MPRQEERRAGGGLPSLLVPACPASLGIRQHLLSPLPTLWPQHWGLKVRLHNRYQQAFPLLGQDIPAPFSLSLTV